MFHKIKRVNNLIHIFHKALFTEDFFRSLWSIRCCDSFTTFTTVSLVEFSRISELHEFPISLSWMRRRKWYTVFDMKCELKTDNLKWLASDRATKHRPQSVVDIFLCCLFSYNSLIILRDMKRFLV